MATVLLVDDDPLQGQVRQSILGRSFAAVQRVGDAVEAFILVEDTGFVRQLGLVVVGLNRPGLSSPVFVDELTSRLPSVPVLVLGPGRDESLYEAAPNVRFLPRTAAPERMLAVSRQMVAESGSARVA
jgi:DNA-binding NtrC family response regulator